MSGAWRAARLGPARGPVSGSGGGPLRGAVPGPVRESGGGAADASSGGPRGGSPGGSGDGSGRGAFPDFKDALARDKADALAPLRARFEISADIVYLDGNSLGALPKSVPARMEDVVSGEWGAGLIRSWNEAGWIDLAGRAAARIAPLVGAKPANIAVADSTSVNMFKVLAAALAMRPGRTAIVTEQNNFPTDNYIAEGLIGLTGGAHRLVRVAAPGDIEGALDGDVAVLMLTHVNYRDGRVHDMARLTEAAHEAGALVIWDLAHSAGALVVDLEGCGADFAIGCGYKYLNGGPGAPAFVYVAPRHLGRAAQPLTGWFAHEAPFAFDPGYRPAGDIAQFQCGTPPVLSLAALDAALQVWEGVSMADVRAKSMALCDYFIELVEAGCPGCGLGLVSPRDAAMRGAQVSFSHPHGYAVMSALIAEGVIGDFRAPDILRFGFAALYTRFADVWVAADRLGAILREGRWDAPRFHARRKVT